jgi:hypothetical protein
LFVDDGGRNTGIRSDVDDAHDLVAALVVDEAQVLAVLCPVDTVYAPGIGEETIVGGNLFPTFDVEKMRSLLSDVIAGLQILMLDQLWLDLIFWCAFDHVDGVLLLFAHAHDGHPIRVRRPVAIVTIGRAFDAICGQLCFRVIGGFYEKIVVAEKERGLAIGGF